MLIFAASIPAAGQASLAEVVAEARLAMRAAGADLRYDALAEPLLAAAGDVACPGEPFEVLRDGFRFVSSEAERACGVAGWVLQVPPGSDHIVVAFRADRSVAAPLGAFIVDAVQEFSVRSDSRGTTMERELFPRDAANGSETAFEYVVPLTDDTEEVTLAWSFRDGGIRPPLPAGSLPTGSRFEANVHAIGVRFLGADVPGLEVGEPFTEERAGGVVKIKEVQFVLPATWFDSWLDSQVEVFVVARGEFSAVRLVLPGGTEVPAEDVRVGIEDTPLARSARGSEPMYAAHVSTLIIAAAGAGDYSLLFEKREPQKELPGGVLPGLAVIAGPSVLVAVAGSAVMAILGVSRRTHHGTAPLLGVVFAVAIIVHLAGRGGPLGLSRWPVAPEARLAFTVLVAAAVLSLALIAVAHLVADRRRRARHDAMRRDLERERGVREEAEESLYSVVHDLKLPLIALEYLIDDITKGIPEREQSEEVRDSARRLRAVIEEMNLLIVDMLAFAKEIGTTDGSGEAWVRPAVKEVADALKPKAEAKEARIVVQPGLDVCLLIPPEALRHILKNLLDNAIKYGPDVGTVVRVSLKQEATRSRPGAVCLEIADNGSGIAPADRERVFKLLTRVPDRQGRTIPGTGVGLAVVQRLVTAQGGSVEIDTAPEGGALFRITWPAERVQQVEEPVADPGWTTPRPASQPGGAAGGSVGTGV